MQTIQFTIELIRFSVYIKRKNKLEAKPRKHASNPVFGLVARTGAKGSL